MVSAVPVAKLELLHQIGCNIIICLTESGNYLRNLAVRISVNHGVHHDVRHDLAASIKYIINICQILFCSSLGSCYVPPSSQKASACNQRGVENQILLNYCVMVWWDRIRQEGTPSHLTVLVSTQLEDIVFVILAK